MMFLVLVLVGERKPNLASVMVLLKMKQVIGQLLNSPHFSEGLYHHHQQQHLTCACFVANAALKVIYELYKLIL